MTKVSKEPLISIIIPVYNVEKYLDKCIESVKNQSYKNIEIVLVDDGSPDKCPEMIDEYAKSDKRIRAIHKKNGGLSDARNEGLKNSNGEYITFIDSDDYISEDYVETLYNLIKKYNVKLSGTAHQVIYKDGNIITKKAEKESVLTDKEALEKLLYDDGIDLTACMKMFHRDLFKDIKFPVGRLYEDAATTYKFIIAAKKMAVSDAKTYNYVMRSDSISNCKFHPKKMDLITSTEEMTTAIKKKYKDLDKAVNRRNVYARLSTLTQLAMSNDYKNYKDIQVELMSYIKKNGKGVLKDSRASKRDKLGIFFTYFGFNMFRFAWKFYTNMTGRKK